MIATILVLGCFIGADPDRSIDFDTQIMPVLTKAGCNAGACHGAAAGRGEFRLSLFGSDPASDHQAIVQEFKGRRVNLARPDDSLLLLKPTAQIRHGGGHRLNLDDDGAVRFQKWIASGALRSTTPRRLKSFEITPDSKTLGKSNDSVLLTAVARFDDGSSEDVSPWTRFVADDSAALYVEGSTVTVRRPGQHVVTARFLDRIVPIRLTLPYQLEPSSLSNGPRNNFIDDEILATLEALRLPIAPASDDATWLRRVRLDLTGRLPGPEEVHGFLADGAHDKRSQFVDRLLNSRDFDEFWAFQLASLFRNHALPNEKQGAAALHAWLQEQLRTRRGFDAIAREILLAKGDSHQNGPAWFWRLSADARTQAELISNAFLGVRLQCANCHNHPLDRWTQDDYHGLAAMFATIDRGRTIRLSKQGATTHPRTGEPARPQFPGVKWSANAEDSRQPFAAWLTASDNPYFAKAIVNRLWKAMFGRGLVEPADDLRDTNPATHPKLIDRLTKDFVDHGYDLRHTLNRIALSSTYGRNGTTTPDPMADDRFYSHSLERPLPAEVLADAWADVTDVSDRYGDEKPGTRAIALADPAIPSRALDLLGRCRRTESCETSASGGGLPAILHRVNGELVNRKITASQGRLHRLIDAGKTDREILNEFYIRALCRQPSAEEWKILATPEGKSRIEWLEDATWALLNCRSFTHNR